MNSRKITSIASIVLGALMIVGGIGTWVMVSSMLGDQNITTPDVVRHADGTRR